MRFIPWTKGTAKWPTDPREIAAFDAWLNRHKPAPAVPAPAVPPHAPVETLGAPGIAPQPLPRPEAPGKVVPWIGSRR